MMKFEEFFQDIVISLYENIRDLEGKMAFADPEEKDYIAGRLFSYGEVLEIIKDSARRFGMDRQELEL
ncbi:hypothetical protein [Dyadobacter sandarakinus]|uniref:Uncharacterized protein n=1 Tax=Dyadobacter sandarakinus TaxID=2747268 RepID=A0ABX7IBH8_9BACT|nr:hypothetical protein [Dyadobacter sandarakinus]QRR03270.1 hypothetical protein HWI92_21305 [Dyadobacter sandarakinus]